MTQDEIAALAVAYGLASTPAAFKAYAVSTRTAIVAALGNHRLADAVNAAIGTAKASNVTVVQVDTTDLNLTEAAWRIVQSVTRGGGVVTITPNGIFTQLPPIVAPPG